MSPHHISNPTGSDPARRRVGRALARASAATILARVFPTVLLGAVAVSAVDDANAQGKDASFDHGYERFDALLRKHVAWNAAGTASAVDYAGLARERAALKQVLDAFSAVSMQQYQGFSRDQRLAFLINAYNAFTLELILTKYPDLASIKDLGSLFRSPWKQRFFTLLGEARTLDWIEHDMIRKPGAFDEPRIHFVVNCASIGCPALRPQAVKASELERQLEDSTRRFLGDRSRNRLEDGKLRVSKIFDWYGDDFRKGHRGIASLPAFFGLHAKSLADDAAGQAAIRGGKVPIEFLDYDWSLNRR
ncbi:MAG: DUF547 domain-containing protein [Lautropia sp.]